MALNIKRALPVIGAFILGVIVVPAIWFASGRGRSLLAARPGRFGGGPYGYPGFGPGFGGFALAGGAASLLLWVLLLAGLVWLVARLSSGAMAASATRFESPLDILKRRYAAGEIDAETFSRMRNDLQQAGPVPS